jgi:hypothetical protein
MRAHARTNNSNGERPLSVADIRHTANHTLDGHASKTPMGRGCVHHKLFLADSFCTARPCVPVWSFSLH